jgi:predicted  nucleic acid-binding Zn-ribbon protein
MSALGDLLHLQEHDTRADQLRHRLAHLPERAACDEHDRRIADHDRAQGALEARRAELQRDQKRIEDEVAGVEAKATEVDRTLYSGSVTSPRELQALQEELAALHRRQRQLEDRILELMEQIEPLDAELAAGVAARAELEERRAELATALAQAERAITAELDAVLAEREAIAATVPADLLARYETLRAQLQGIAVAPLTGGSCGGCHLQLSAVELDRIRRQPPDALVTCEECGRLLVR